MVSGGPHLGDSWVVEGGDSSFEEYSQDEILEPVPPPSRSSRRFSKSTSTISPKPEPELVMPSMIIESTHTSSTETPTRVTRQQVAQSAERYWERKRIARSNPEVGDSEKRPQQAIYRGKQIKEEPCPSTNNTQDVLGTTLDHILAIMSWLLDVLAGALKVLKKPLSYLLAVWLLFGVFVVLRNLATRSIYASLSPICRIPGASLLELPFCTFEGTSSKDGRPPPDVEFEQLMTVQSQFEEVLKESAGGVSLPLDMKRGEASIRDLRQLVKYSGLHSKNELVLEFDGFIETARIASYDLQKFNSHVGRAVDSVIATTRWTTRVLDGIQERDASIGSMNAFINDKLLAPFQPVKFTENILLDQYIQHTRIVEEEILKLIQEAQAILMVLTNLEDRLEVIQGIAIRETTSKITMKDEILSELWTMVGGNKGKLNKMARQLDLLKQVAIYRKTAYAHVSGTIIRLQAMGAGLEDLRERVGSPELLRDRLDIPLSVHIENIQKGVERLEESRQNARKVEDNHIRRALDRGQLESNMIDG